MGRHPPLFGPDYKVRNPPPPPVAVEAGGQGGRWAVWRVGWLVGWLVGWWAGWAKVIGFD